MTHSECDRLYRLFEAITNQSPSEWAAVEALPPHSSVEDKGRAILSCVDGEIRRHVEGEISSSYLHRLVTLMVEIESVLPIMKYLVVVQTASHCEFWRYTPATAQEENDLLSISQLTQDMYKKLTAKMVKVNRTGVVSLQIVYLRLV